MYNVLYFFKKKTLTKFKTLSNNKYRQLNLENLVYFINYILLENNLNIYIYIIFYEWFETKTSKL